MNNIENIRQEIERRKKGNMYDDLPITIGRYYEDRDLLAFIDSLPEEICKDSLQVKEICKENPDSFTGDLNNELENYYGRVPDDDDKINAARHFAEWGASRIPMPEDTVIFMKGMEEGRRLERDDLALTWQDIRRIVKIADDLLDDPRFRENSVELYIEDEITEDGLDCGCVDIVYNFQVFWSLCKGTASKEWLCTVDNEFRNDVWIPSVKTRADFKRLFRVATGFDLPLYMDI